MKVEIKNILVKHVGETHKPKPDSDFIKRDIVLVEPGEYENLILVQAVKDKCSYLDSIQAGDSIEISFFINGRAHGDGTARRVYNNLTLAYIKKIEPTQAETVAAAEPVAQADDEQDTLPF